MTTATVFLALQVTLDLLIFARTALCLSLSDPDCFFVRPPATPPHVLFQVGCHVPEAGLLGTFFGAKSDRPCDADG